MFLALLLLPATAEEMTLPEKTWDGVTATVSIRVAEQTPQPGTARVRLRLTVEGPADLVVEVLPLEDALAGWRVPLRTSSIRPDDRCRWECTLGLVQVKPGVVPLPGVRIRVHSGGKSGEIAWPDLLNEAAEVASVVELAPPSPSPWPGRLRWVALASLGLLGLAGVVLGVRRWSTRPGSALPPLVAALAAIDRLQQSPADPVHLVAELDGVLRAYLETLGVPATRMTGVELRGALRAILGAEALALILTRGEELKFAGSQVSRDQAQELASEARGVIASLGEEGRRG
jgi:hypothetical protein